MIPAIAAGTSESVEITFNIDGTVTGIITNETEISKQTAIDGDGTELSVTDIDSTPDADQSNGDEDDNDVAQLDVYTPS